MTADAHFLDNRAAVASTSDKKIRVFAKCYSNRLREDKIGINT